MTLATLRSCGDFSRIKPGKIYVGGGGVGNDDNVIIMVNILQPGNIVVLSLV